MGIQRCVSCRPGRAVSVCREVGRLHSGLFRPASQAPTPWERHDIALLPGSEIPVRIEMSGRGGGSGLLQLSG